MESGSYVFYFHSLQYRPHGEETLLGSRKEKNPLFTGADYLLSCSPDHANGQFLKPDKIAVHNHTQVPQYTF